MVPPSGQSRYDFSILSSSLRLSVILNLVVPLHVYTHFHCVDTLSD